MPQVYDRDLAITAVMCFAGGAGLVLLVVLACYRALRKKILKERERPKEEEKEGSTVANHGVHHSGADERKRDALLQANSNSLDTRLEGHGGHVWSRSDEDSAYFRCSDCSNKGQRALRPNLMMWNNRINTEMEEDEEKEKRTGRMVEEERRVANRPNGSSPVYETDRDMDSSWVNVEGRSTGKETFHCESCHRTYSGQQSIRAGRFKSGTRDSAPPAHRWTEKGRSYNQLDATKAAELGREARNVTFDLEGVVRDGEGRTPRGKGAKIQSSQLLKVKLNLHPLRKSRVHPRRRNEHECAAEKGSSKRSRDKRPRGKDRREKGGKGKSGDKVEGSPEKAKKAAGSRRRSDDVKEDEDKAGGKHSDTVQEQSENPEDAQSAPTDQAPDSQGGMVQYQGTGLSLSAPERTQTTNLSLLGSAGSQLTGSGLSLQGGNLLLSSVAPRFKAVFPAAPSIATSGPSMGPSGALDSFSRQTGLNLMSPAASLLTNSSVRAGSIQTTPLYDPPAGGLALNLAAANSQTQLLPDSVSLPPRLTVDPTEALGLQLGEELNKLIPESQAPEIAESLAVQVQAVESVPVASSQAPNTQTEPGEAAPAEGPAADATVSVVSGDGADGAVLLHQEYVTEEGDSSPRRKLKLALPEKTSSRPPTALERKIR